MSLEQYLSMDDQELQELNGLGNEFSSEAPNPFYKSSLKDIARGKVDKPTDNNADSDYIQEREPTLLSVGLSTFPLAISLREDL